MTKKKTFLGMDTAGKIGHLLPPVHDLQRTDVREVDALDHCRVAHVSAEPGHRLLERCGRQWVDTQINVAQREVRLAVHGKESVGTAQPYPARSAALC